MRFILAISLFFISVVLSSCNNKVKAPIVTTSTTDTIALENNKIEIDHKTVDVYFKATGTEPFWGLELSDHQIKLNTIGDSIIMPNVAPVRAMDANVKLYKIQTESHDMTIQIAQSECTNAMSGKVSAYTVTIDYKSNTHKNPTTLQGCGDYITDYRLHDIWVLEQMNGNTVTTSDFSKDLPSMEINSTTNKFSGFAGCNRMGGSLFFEKGLLRFTNIITTEMLCEPTNKEDAFLKALQSTTTYVIGNNRLTLSNPDGELLIFKKID